MSKPKVVRAAAPLAVFGTLLLHLLLVVAPPGALQGQVVVLDTFEDEAAGQPPVAPDAGSYASPDGSHLVYDQDGDLVLRSAFQDQTLSRFSWYQIYGGAVGSAAVRYVARLEPGVTSSASDYAVHRIVLLTTGDTSHGVGLEWSNTGTWSIDGGAAIASYSLGTDYEFVWAFDFVADTFDLSIGGVPVATDQAIGADVKTASEVNLRFYATGAHRIDDVRVDLDLLFADGFEHGSPGTWSALAPAQLIGDECPVPDYLAQGIGTPGTLDGFTGSTGDDSSCGGSDTKDHWFLYTAQCSGTVTITTCLPGTEFDSVLSAFDGCDGTELACNDDSVSGGAACEIGGSVRKSTISFATLAGESYRVRVSAYGDSLPVNERDFEVRAECAP